VALSSSTAFNDDNLYRNTSSHLRRRGQMSDARCQMRDAYPRHSFYPPYSRTNRH
jgi:hypothetical protein